MANCKSLLMLLALSVFVLFLASFTYAEEANAEEIEQGDGSDAAQLSFARRGRRIPRRQPDAIFRSPTQIVYSNVNKKDVQYPEQPIVPSVECQVPVPIVQTETIVRTIVQTATETVPQVIERTLTCNVPQFIERTLTETNVETETVTQTVPRLIQRTLTCTIPQFIERTTTETNVETETVTQTVPRLIERTLTCTIPIERTLTCTVPIERTMTETNVETETVTQTVPQVIERTLTCTVPQYIERTLTETITQAARSKHYVKPLATTERSTFEASSRLTIIGSQKSSFETTKQPAHRPFYTRIITDSVFSSPTVSPVIRSTRSSNVEDNDDDMSEMNQPSGTYY
jgi:hypothetical protein